MPTESGQQGRCLLCHPEFPAEIGKRVRGASRQDLAAQREGVDPWTESVCGKSAQETLLRPRAVCRDPSTRKAPLDFGPE